VFVCVLKMQNAIESDMYDECVNSDICAEYTHIRTYTRTHALTNTCKRTPKDTRTHSKNSRYDVSII